jgi:hypothetical protein
MTATFTTDPSTFGVTVRQIQDTTSTTDPSYFEVNSTYPATGTALASPGQLLTVQISIENNRGDPDRCTIRVTDPYNNQSFLGEAIMDWSQGDLSTLWVEFSGFPLQADQSTPMDKCDYSIEVYNSTDRTSGTNVYAHVYTI